MGTLIDYVDWRGDIKFTTIPVNEVDSLIISLIAYIPFDDIIPPPEEGSVTLLSALREFVRRNKESPIQLGKFMPKELMTLAIRMAKSRRFGGARLSNYVNDINLDEQRQFCAFTMQITKDKYFIVFRGTDDTLVGWKESFNMSFMQPIPAQLAAVDYLKYAASTFDGKMYICGHSKGGNLSVYSASQTDSKIKDRIIEIYNNDGPGFNREFIESPEYLSIKDRTHSLVPQSSVIGMLLEHEENYEVVKSSAAGIMQHTGHTWEVMGGSFIHLDSVTEDSRLIDTKLKEWLDSMTLEERESFVDTVYEAFTSLNATTVTELSAEKLKLIKAYKSLDPKTKSLLNKSIAILVKHNALTLKK